MTNGEKMLNTFHGKVTRCDETVFFTTGGWHHAYDAEWWNAEYKEPTKNDSEIDIAIKIIKADDLAPYSVDDILKARDLAVEALKQMGTTKNDSKFCPDRKAKTTHMETLLHCVEDECVAYKDGKCLKYNSNQEPTTKNDSSELEKNSKKNSKKLEEPQTFKWCTDCREYDQEKHCCHRWSKTIRNTVEEVKQEYIEREVLDKIRAEIKSLERFEIRGEVTPLVNVDRVLEIIDKAESEEK